MAGLGKPCPLSRRKIRRLWPIGSVTRAQRPYNLYMAVVSPRRSSRSGAGAGLRAVSLADVRGDLGVRGG
jgi:hypothetical protein